MATSIEMVDDLGAGIDRVLLERDEAQAKLEHARTALKLIARRSTDEHVRNMAPAALDFVGVR